MVVGPKMMHSLRVDIDVLCPWIKRRCSKDNIVNRELPGIRWLTMRVTNQMGRLMQDVSSVCPWSQTMAWPFSKATWHPKNTEGNFAPFKDP